MCRDDGEESIKQKMSVDDAVEAVGCGSFQYRILFAAGLCFSADGTQVLLLSFLAPFLSNKWSLSPEKSALIVSVLFAGSLFGTLILGPMGDVYGRRPIYLLSSSIVSLFGLGTGFATTYNYLLATIFCIGFGVGGLTVPFDILTECLPNAVRGQFLLQIEYFWTIGTLSVPLFAYLTIGLGKSWNIFVIVCSIPCIIGTITGAFLVPESPHWLVAQGRSEEALALLRRAAVINKKDPYETLPEETEIQVEVHETSGYAELFRPKWRRITILMWIVWMGFAFCYYGTIMTVTRIFHSESDDGSASFDYKDIFISSSAEFVGTFIAIRSVDRIGRISSQAIFYFLGGCFVASLCIFSQNAPFFILSSLAFGGRAFEMSACCCTWVSTAEVFGTEVRTTGHSSANAVARIGGILTPFLVESNLSFSAIGVILFVIHAIVVLVVRKVPETMGKKLGETTPQTEESYPLSQDENVQTEQLYDLTTDRSLELT